MLFVIETIGDAIDMIGMRERGMRSDRRENMVKMREHPLNEPLGLIVCEKGFGRIDIWRF